MSSRRSGQILLAVLLGLCIATAAAQVRYSDAELSERLPNYRDDLGVNYREVMLPRITPRERAALENARIQFPLRMEGDGLFGYYSAYGTDGPKIVMPVSSLRFLSDLCVATAWLWANGYSQSTLHDYLGMLKYRRPQDLGLIAMPQPLPALGVPDNATDEPAVERVRSQCFSTAVVFVLAHEMGHLILGHRGYEGVTPEQAQANEAAADDFALDLMSRLGDLPFGVLFFFTYAAYIEPHRGDFGGDDAWRTHVAGKTHPLSAGRILALADGIEQRAGRFAAGTMQARSLAADLRVVGETLADPDIQQLLRLQGQSVRPYMLASRKGDVWEVSPPPEPLPDGPFSGFFTGWMGSGPEDGIEVSLVLFRQGDRVHGRYSYAGIAGTVRGRVENGVLDYEFVEPGSSGIGRLEMIGEGAISGRWRSRSGREGALGAERGG
ncbi:MAG: hypothetical protein U5S82_21155 [Gammaproteobacteria bacterium]|nr:hypothetical protein [Gammaproteobacteria bacterium]